MGNHLIEAIDLQTQAGFQLHSSEKSKGQLISKRLFDFSILPKNEQKISASVGLGQKLTFSSSFF